MNDRNLWLRVLAEVLRLIAAAIAGATAGAFEVVP